MKQKPPLLDPTDEAILYAVKRGTKHTSASVIIKVASEILDKELTPGATYPRIKRLEGRGYLTSYIFTGGRWTKCYEITAAGRGELSRLENARKRMKE